MENSEYQKYLASREWALKKEAIKKRSSGKCERCCLGKYQQTHHLTYEHIGNEPIEDLQGICKQCHEYLSAKSNIDPLMEAQVLNLLDIYCMNSPESPQAKAAIEGLSKTTLSIFPENLLVTIWALGLYPTHFIKKLKLLNQIDMVRFMENINGNLA